jgi:hypothetical protein
MHIFGISNKFKLYIQKISLGYTFKCQVYLKYIVCISITYTMHIPCISNKFKLYIQKIQLDINCISYEYCMYISCIF